MIPCHENDEIVFYMPAVIRCLNLDWTLLYYITWEITFTYRKLTKYTYIQWDKEDFYYCYYIVPAITPFLPLFK